MTIVNEQRWVIHTKTILSRAVKVPVSQLSTLLTWKFPFPQLATTRSQTWIAYMTEVAARGRTSVLSGQSALTSVEETLRRWCSLGKAGQSDLDGDSLKLAVDRACEHLRSLLVTRFGCASGNDIRCAKLSRSMCLTGPTMRVGILRCRDVCGVWGRPSFPSVGEI